MLSLHSVGFLAIAPIPRGDQKSTRGTGSKEHVHIEQTNNPLPLQSNHSCLQLALTSQGQLSQVSRKARNDMFCHFCLNNLFLWAQYSTGHRPLGYIKVKQLIPLLALIFSSLILNCSPPRSPALVKQWGFVHELRQLGLEKGTGWEKIKDILLLHSEDEHACQGTEAKKMCSPEARLFQVSQNLADLQSSFSFLTFFSSR